MIYSTCVRFRNSTKPPFQQNAIARTTSKRILGLSRLVITIDFSADYSALSTGKSLSSSVSGMKEELIHFQQMYSTPRVGCNRNKTIYTLEQITNFVHCQLLIASKLSGIITIRFPLC